MSMSGEAIRKSNRLSARKRHKKTGGVKMKKFLYGALILAVALFVMFGAFTPQSQAATKAKKAAKPEDVFTFRDGAWRVKSGGKQKEFEGISGTGERKSGPIEWCVVNPDEQEEAKGLKAGILLYVKDMEEYQSPYTFLLLKEEAVQVDGVSFNPSGWETAAVISRGGRFTELLSLYDLESLYMEYDGTPFESDPSFLARSDAVFWVETGESENHSSLSGLAFTMADEEVQRPEEAGLFASTAAIYYPPQTVAWVNDGLVVLKKATKTESYEVSGMSEDGTEVTIAVTSVKSEKDWKDIDKWVESEIKVKVPVPEEAM
jgi:hypothetical protein